jgi:hypothetical protein
MRVALAIMFVGATCIVAAAQDSPSVSIGASVERDRFTYHFTNPSSFDTAAVVPHFFEQRYIADNVWVDAEARYVAGVRWTTNVGATPGRTAIADDYDTFFNPDGTVIVSGTTGDARMHAFRISQRAEIARASSVRFDVGYSFRLDTADFGVGHKTVTHNATLVEAFDVTTREFTTSQVHEVFVGVATNRSLSSRWRVSVTGDVAPTTVGRLLVQLPDKYPGQDLVFLAKVLSARGSLVLSRAGKWPIHLSVDGGRTWSYHAEDALARTSLALRFALGMH